MVWRECSVRVQGALAQHGWLAEMKYSKLLCTVDLILPADPGVRGGMGKDGRAGAAGRSDLASRQALHSLASTPQTCPIMTGDPRLTHAHCTHDLREAKPENYEQDGSNGN